MNYLAISTTKPTYTVDFYRFALKICGTPMILNAVKNIISENFIGFVVNFLSHEENTLVFFPRFLSLAVMLVPFEQGRCKRKRKIKIISY